MTFGEFVLVAVISVGGAAATAGISIWANKRFGAGPLAKEVDEEESKLIVVLRGRVEAAEANASAAVTRAQKAEDLAKDTESRRAGCEEEIGRLKRDLRATERELIELYRRSGETAPKTLVKRQADHQREDAT